MKIEKEREKGNKLTDWVTTQSRRSLGSGFCCCRSGAASVQFSWSYSFFNSLVFHYCCCCCFAICRTRNWQGNCFFLQLASAPHFFSSLFFGVQVCVCVCVCVSVCLGAAAVDRREWVVPSFAVVSSFSTFTAAVQFSSVQLSNSSSASVLTKRIEGNQTARQAGRQANTANLGSIIYWPQSLPCWLLPAQHWTVLYCTAKLL